MVEPRKTSRETSTTLSKPSKRDQSLMEDTTPGDFSAISSEGSPAPNSRKTQKKKEEALKKKKEKKVVNKSKKK